MYIVINFKVSLNVILCLENYKTLFKYLYSNNKNLLVEINTSKNYYLLCSKFK